MNVVNKLDINQMGIILTLTSPEFIRVIQFARTQKQSIAENLVRLQAGFDFIEDAREWEKELEGRAAWFRKVLKFLGSCSTVKFTYDLFLYRKDIELRCLDKKYILSMGDKKVYFWDSWCGKFRTFDDIVENWHLIKAPGSINEFLGLSLEKYRKLVENPNLITYDN